MSDTHARHAARYQAAALVLVGATLITNACASRAQPAKEIAMSRRAAGSFDVKLTPQETADKTMGHILIAKQFRGDLEGTSTGEMFTSDTGVEGSAGYVARERITGTLHGKTGSFIVQHLGTMRRGGSFNLRIEIVPDSGTGQLVGLAGAMKIIIEPDGKHLYELDYDIER
jgi:hypothetical protein